MSTNDIISIGALIISLIAVIISYLLFRINRKSFDLQYVKPFMVIVNAINEPIKNDIAKTPQSEKFIRIYIYNPSSFGNYVKLNCQQMDLFRASVLRREDIEGKKIDGGKIQPGHYVRLPPSERIFFDLFAHAKIVDNIGQKLEFTITDIKCNRIKEHIII